ncbi:MAG: succinate dehydrogenase cytochrome b subunit [Caldilineales bacterium]|nr:succinate dehydrogenase cytochrome b subunit [Caldilineales bacterium]
MQSVQVLSFPRTTIGKKVIMALTGILWIGYVVLHMYGNLKIFVGPEYFNHYSEALREIGAPIFGYEQLLWVIRLILIPAVILHMWAALSLTVAARKARPGNYEAKRTLAANYASKTMRLGGVVIIAFILFHLAQLTFGMQAVLPGFEAGNPYDNVLIAFSSPIVVAFYVIAVAFLGLHLYHGGWSMMQTLGWLNERFDRLVRVLAALLGLVVAVGFAIVPIAVLLGLVS